jgi:ribosomal protein S18 acetylase RimI-like enzyme
MAILRQIRAARPQDAGAMADILNEIISIGGTTAFHQTFDEQRIVSEFVQPELCISCFVAVDEGRLSGFQALEWCDPEWPGEDRLPPDWAVVATYVDPGTRARRAGSDLFDKTAQAAKEAGVRFIDATIRKENTGGLAFYEKMGFIDYRSSAETISKQFAPV